MRRRLWLTPELPALIDIALISALLIIVCERVFGLGILHTDDAVWALAAHNGVDPIVPWAESQGRLWAFVSGPMMLHAMSVQGTAYGEVLRLGSFAVFFSIFHAVLWTYFGRRIALLCAALLLGLTVVRWDGSLFVTYPLHTWVMGSFFGGSLLALHAYARTGSVATAAGAGLLLFASLFTHEGTALMFAMLFPMFVYCNAGHSIEPPRFFPMLKRRHIVLLLIWLVAVVTVVAMAMAWSAAHPTVYQGRTLAPFDVGRIVRTTVQFTLGSTVLSDALQPYVVVYADQLRAAGDREVYSPADYLGSAFSDVKSLLVCFIAVVLALRATWGVGSVWRVRLRETLVALFVGSTVAIVPILPVALTAQYQGLVLDQDVRAYSHTILAQFGVALAAAAALNLLFLVLGRIGLIARVAKLAIAVLVGAGSAIGSSENDAIVGDMRLEAGRWRVLDHAIHTLDAELPQTMTVIAPRFQNGSWFTVVPEGYWTEYSRHRYGANFGITTRTSLPDEVDERTVLLDYALADDGRTFFVFAAPLAARGGDVVTDKIVIYAAPVQRHLLATTYLSFRTADQVVQSVRLADIPRSEANPRVRVLTSAPIEARSIRFSSGRMLDVESMQIECGTNTPVATDLVFGSAPSDEGGCFAADALGAGWHPPEARGVWSDGSTAELVLRSSDWPPGDLRIAFDMSSYTSMGFTEGTQTVIVNVNGRRAVRWVFTQGAQPPETVVSVPASWRSLPDELRIVFEIDPPLVPQELGLASDSRSLGVHLRALEISPAS